MLSKPFLQRQSKLMRQLLQIVIDEFFYNLAIDHVCII